MDKVFHMGIATIGLELKVENERSTVVGFFCLHSVDLQNTLKKELKCMPHLQHDYLTYLTIRLRARVFYEQIVNEAQSS